MLELTHELNAIEDHVYGETGGMHEPGLAPLRRTAVRLHRHLRTVLALLRRASSAEEDEVPSDSSIGRAPGRPAGGRSDRDVFALQERARLLHEEIVHQGLAETPPPLHPLADDRLPAAANARHRLFFGMNTGGMPFRATWRSMAPGWPSASYLGSMGVAWLILRRIGIL